MLNIYSCLQQRQTIRISFQNDGLLERLLDSGRDEIFCILPSGYFDVCGHKRIRAIKAKWHLLCSIDLDKILPGVATTCVLYGLSKTPNKTIYFAQWRRKDIFSTPSEKHRWRNSGDVLGRATTSDLGEFPFTQLPEEYKCYLADCEQFVNTGAVPQDSDFAEYTSLDRSELIENKWTPGLYSKEHLDLRRKLKTAHTVPLADIAEIHIAHPEHHEQSVPTLRAVDASLPFFPEKIQPGLGSDVELQHGDVVLSTVRGTAIVYSGQDGAFAGSGLAVLRPMQGICPEYLCLYLASDVARNIFFTLVSGINVPRIKLKDLKRLPVLLPNLDEGYYRAEYAKLANPQQRDYIPLKRLRTGQLTDVESILDAEIARKIQAHNDEQLREFLTSDLRELNTCFAHGAYKAAIILAGSILEAVLTDWLSEIHGTNYFETNYMIEMQNGHYRRAGLSDMIDEIKELEKPDWLEEARLAHKIRKKRNLVHAALCVKAEDVSEQTAHEVIEYLDKVLRTRGVRSAPQEQDPNEMPIAMPQAASCHLTPSGSPKA